MPRWTPNTRYSKKYKKVVQCRQAKNIRDVMDVAMKALNIALKVKKLINVEFKYKDGSGAGVVSTTAGLVTNLTNIANGSEESQRNGDKVRAKSIHIKGRCFHNASGSAAQTMRLLLIQDRANPNPGTTDPLVTGANYGVLATADINSLTANEQRTRYKILAERYYNVNLTAMQSRQVNIYKSLDIPIQFQDATTELVVKNNLWLVTLSTEATNSPSFSIKWRLRYIDN